MEIHVTIPDTLAEKFRKLTGLGPAEVMREAMTFYNWTIDETDKGRLILSATADGESMTRLKFPPLEGVAHRRVERFSREVDDSIRAGTARDVAVRPIRLKPR
jgi:hypothetical protein